jgi:hypothetical protein
MGQQQLLLIILGVIVVGIAVAVGVSQFGAQSDESNKDGIMNDLQALSSNAYQYKIRPSSLGGGNNSYTGYQIPSKLVATENARYTISGSASQGQITFTGTSVYDGAKVATCVVDSMGTTSVSYSGW